MFQSDSGRTARTRPLRRKVKQQHRYRPCMEALIQLGRRPRKKRKGSRPDNSKAMLSKLNSMAFGLAVKSKGYASLNSMVRVTFAGRVTPPPRKTRFRPLVRRYRTGFPPARFRCFLTTSSPFPKLLGAMLSTDALSRLRTWLPRPVAWRHQSDYTTPLVGPCPDCLKSYSADMSHPPGHHMTRPSSARNGGGRDEPRNTFGSWRKSQKPTRS